MVTCVQELLVCCANAYKSVFIISADMLMRTSADWFSSCTIEYWNNVCSKCGYYVKYILQYSPTRISKLLKKQLSLCVHARFCVWNMRVCTQNNVRACITTVYLRVSAYIHMCLRLCVGLLFFFKLFEH